MTNRQQTAQALRQDELLSRYREIGPAAVLAAALAAMPRQEQRPVERTRVPVLEEAA